MTHSILIAEPSMLPQTDNSDAALIQAAQDDPEAFTALYERYMTNVYRYILSRVGDVQDAEDLTTQTFMVILNGLDTYRGQGTFLAWSFGIARRKVADFFRQKSQNISLEQAAPMPDKTASPETELEHTLQLERVMACLAAIAPDRAEAITLRIFGGLTTAEIATVMERSEDAVHALVSRGMQDLRTRLNTNS